MAGGLALVGLALALLVYLIADRVKPRRGRAVAVMEEFRRAWKRYYGWTYLERPLSGEPIAWNARVGGWLADALKIKGLFVVSLDKAGTTVDPDLFVFWHVALTFLAAQIAYFVGGMFLAVVFALAAAGAPFLMLPAMAARRRALIEEQLPDTLQLIGSLLRAGHGFPQALSAVTKETQPPISVALKKVLAEVSLGGTIEEGLDKMAVEIHSVALAWTVTAIKIQREVGGNLAEILDILALSVRERGELNRQIKALTAEGRLSAYVLLALPFVLGAILYLTNAAYVSLLWKTTPGLIMLALALAMMAFGSAWLWRIVKVEV